LRRSKIRDGIDSSLDTNGDLKSQGYDSLLVRGLRLFNLLSPLSDFVSMVAIYLAEIWDFLIFLGRVSGVIVILVGAILWFTDANPGRGKGLVASGILLSIVVQYFVMYPPSFVL
jgi:hypothetical protein